jgi:hypothetical protein
MDQELVVDDRITDGKKLLTQLAQDGFEISAAYWIRSSEGSWRLYLASPLVATEGAGKAFGRVYLSLAKLRAPGVSVLDLRLIDPDNPSARAVQEIQRRHPAFMPLRTGPTRLGDLDVEETHIYPRIVLPRPLNGNGIRVKLKREVEPKFRPEEYNAPLSPEERDALARTVAAGVSPMEAEYFIRRKRAAALRRPLPADSIVTAYVVGWWGAKPEDDPNPLLLVESADGTQGLTFKNDTEPV